MNKIRPWERYVTQAELAIFAAAGYGRRAGLDGPPALIVIDVNIGFLGVSPEDTLTSIARFRNSCGRAGWEAVEVINSLLVAARKAGRPVIFTTGRDDDRDIKAATWARKSSRALEDYDNGNRALHNKIPDIFGVRNDDLVIRKSHASVFFGTLLDIHLRALDVHDLIMCGTSTSGCVRASVIDAFSLGYRVGVVADACFDRSDFSHAASLFDIDQKYADVLDGATAAAILADHQTTRAG